MYPFSCNHFFLFHLNLHPHRVAVTMTVPPSFASEKSEQQSGHGGRKAKGHGGKKVKAGMAAVLVGLTCSRQAN